MKTVKIICMLFFFVMGSVVLATVSFASSNKMWDGGGSDTEWTNPLNWEGDTLPYAGDNVYIRTQTKDVSVHYNWTNPLSLKYVRMGNNSAGYDGTVDFSAYSNLSANDMYIADYGNATFSQYGNIVSLTSLHVGSGDDSSGKYSLRNNGKVQASSSIGIGKNGTFSQSGGQVSASSIAVDGNTVDPASDKGYTLHDGIVSTEYLSLRNTGRFYQANGSASVRSWLKNYDGNYILQTGTLSAGTYETMGIGEGKNAYFTQNGGTHTVNSDLRIGDSNGTGVYEMNAGTLNVGRIEELGSLGSGTFKQFAGQHYVGDTMKIGVSGQGRYEMYNDALLTAPSIMLYTVDGEPNASAYFLQNGGTVSVDRSLGVTKNSEYNLKKGTVETGYNLLLNSGGVFQQQGGFVKTDRGIYISDGGVYNYEMNAGGAVGINGNIEIKRGGTFHHGSGTVDGSVTNAGEYYGDHLVKKDFNNYGTLFLGGDATDAAYFRIDGDFRAYESNYADRLLLSMDIFGNDRGLTYDCLDIMGDAWIDGDFEVNLLNDFTPEIGDSFNMMYAAEGIKKTLGDFNYILPELSGGKWWEVVTDTNNIFLKVNGDPNAAPVPEPATIILAGLGLAGLVLRRKK